MYKYSSNAMWLISEKVVRTFVTICVGFYIVRYLGPKSFGELSYALAWLAIFGAVTNLGLDSIVLREIVQKPCKSDAILSTAIGLKLVAGISILLLSGVLYLVCGSEIGFVFIVSFALIFQPINICEIFFQAQAESRVVVKSQVAQSIISAGVKLLLVFAGASLQWFVWSYVLDAILLALAGIAVLVNTKRAKISPTEFDFSLAKRLVAMAFPALLAGVCTAIYMKIDLIMLEWMATPDDLGAYSAAAKLSECWYFVPAAICTAYTPMLIKARDDGAGVFELKLKALYNILVWGSVAISIFVTVFSGLIVRIVYGETFMNSAHLLNVHIWAGVFVCIGLVNSVSLLAQDQLYQNLVRALIGALLNVVLNLLWIPKWGGLGAAYATLVAYAFTAWISILFFKNGRHQFFITIQSIWSFPKFVR